MHAPYKYIGLSALLCALFLMTGIVASAQDDPVAQVLIRINQARANANLPALTRNAQLDAAAQGHANDLLQNGVQLGHSGSDGSSITQRIVRTGYNGDTVGENWASYRTMDLVMQFWLTDPPHRHNILNPRFSEIGIGVAPRANGGLIVVTDFGGHNGGAPVQVAHAAAAPQKARPTQIPVRAKPKPSPTPTRRPTRKPITLPTLLPTQPPPVTQIALAQPAPKITVKPLHARGKFSRLTLTGQARAAASLSEIRGDGAKQFFGGALALGGMLLVGVAMIGQRRRHLRL